MDEFKNSPLEGFQSLLYFSLGGGGQLCWTGWIVFVFQLSTPIH